MEDTVNTKTEPQKIKTGLIPAENPSNAAAHDVMGENKLRNEN